MNKQELDKKLKKIRDSCGSNVIDKDLDGIKTTLNENKRKTEQLKKEIEFITEPIEVEDENDEIVVENAY